jgi:dephospho-CoA kinase
MSHHPLRLGLTGGIGSGKSTVAKMLADFGAVVIDADLISRSLTAPQGMAIEAIRIEFGDIMITPENSLDRERMRDLIFTHASAKSRLESIIHPLVKLETLRQYQSALKANSKLVVYDIPLLAESANWRPVLDQILVIDCLEETQIKRVMTRNNLKHIDVAKIISNQANRKMRNSVADILIFNDSISVEQLRAQVMQVTQHLGFNSMNGISSDPLRIPI